MTKENEITQKANNSSIRDSETKEAFQRGFSAGLKQGRIEGMIAYQKHLVENIQKENASLTKKLSEAKL